MNGPNVTEEPVKLEGFGPKDLYQKREKIFTRFVGGFFQRLRFFTGWPLLTGYFLLPWINWGGTQAVLFDLPARQFHIFTLTFYPQDFWLLGWMLMIAAFGLFTIKNGRNGNMPAFADVLDEQKAHILAGYVTGLSK